MDIFSPRFLMQKEFYINQIFLSQIPLNVGSNIFDPSFEYKRNPQTSNVYYQN